MTDGTNLGKIAYMVRRSRALLLALPVLAAVAAVPTAAGAASVVYVQGNEVWQSALDGSAKRRLSAGEGDWRSVAAADGGRIVGVRLEAGKISQLSRFRVWEPSGATLSEGPLPPENANGTYAYPVGLDLTADGANVLYGFSVQRGLVPNATFERGFYGTSTQNQAGLQPIKVTGWEWPTVVGTRVVAANGTTIGVQPPEGAPFGSTFAPWFDVAGVQLAPGVAAEPERTDVAADGRTVALELASYQGAVERRKIAIIATPGLGLTSPTPSTDCFLPTDGLGSDVSLSQDGAVVAWKDAGGVKVAGRPSGTADTCALASPPVVLAADAKSPSISGVDVPTVAPGPAPPGGGAGTPTPGAPAPGGGGAGAPAGTVTTPKLRLTLPKRLTAAALAKGVALKVAAPKAGTVSATGRVPGRKAGKRSKAPVTVASGSARAKKAGTVTVRLRLKKAYRTRPSRLRGATLTVRVAQGKATTTAKVRLR